jgi:peptidoglycan/xylan/chitin deacetylase (PgdA/CDA1 family)
MTSAFKKTLHFASCCIPRGSLGKIIRFPLLAPFYHLVSDEEVPHVKHLFGYRTIDRFKKDMEFFLRYYHPITLNDVIVYARTGNRLPEKSFFLSFDDGLRENYDIVAPILKEMGIPASFFVTTAALDNEDMIYRHKASLLVDHLATLQPKNIAGAKSVLAKHGIQNNDSAAGVLSVKYKGRDVLDQIARSFDLDFKEYLAQKRPYLSTSEIKRLISEGFTVGAHSIDHPFYAELSIEEQLCQTKESVNAVTQVFELNYRTFAFPFGDKGVSKRFFSRVLTENIVDVVFGSNGAFCNDEYFPFSIQRLGMENQPYSAGHILRMEETKSILRSITGTAGTRRRE